MSEGLRMVGRGLAACPYDGRAIEQLVVLPPGEDRMNVCAELAPPSWVGRAGAVLARFGAAALTSPDPEQQNSGMALAALRSSEYIANHLPSVVFDAAMRQLSVEADPARKLTPCQAAALRLPQCIVSSKCDTAVRPPGARQCRTCGSDATCQQYYGSAHAKCDHRCDLSWCRVHCMVAASPSHMHLLPLTHAPLAGPHSSQAGSATITCRPRYWAC